MDYENFYVKESAGVVKVLQNWSYNMCIAGNMSEYNIYLEALKQFHFHVKESAGVVKVHQNSSEFFRVEAQY